MSKAIAHEPDFCVYRETRKQKLNCQVFRLQVCRKDTVLFQSLISSQSVSESLNPMDQLPSELYFLIFRYLDNLSWCRALQVCKSWHSVTTEIIAQERMKPNYVLIPGSRTCTHALTKEDVSKKNILIIDADHGVSSPLSVIACDKIDADNLADFLAGLAGNKACQIGRTTFSTVESSDCSRCWITCNIIDLKASSGLNSGRSISHYLRKEMSIQCLRKTMIVIVKDIYQISRKSRAIFDLIFFRCSLSPSQIQLYRSELNSHVKRSTRHRVQLSSKYFNEFIRDCQAIPCFVGIDQKTAKHYRIDTATIDFFNASNPTEKPTSNPEERCGEDSDYEIDWTEF